MEVHPDKCLFCDEALPGAAPDGPGNLPYTAHLADHGPCQEAFNSWTDNMATYFLG